jgi:hypothetical protein
MGRLKAIMKALFRVSVSEGTIAAAIACVLWWLHGVNHLIHLFDDT